MALSKKVLALAGVLALITALLIAVLALAAVILVTMNEESTTVAPATTPLPNTTVATTRLLPTSPTTQTLAKSVALPSYFTDTNTPWIPALADSKSSWFIQTKQQYEQQLLPLMRYGYPNNNPRLTVDSFSDSSQSAQRIRSNRVSEPSVAYVEVHFTVVLYYNGNVQPDASNIAAQIQTNPAWTPSKDPPKEPKKGWKAAADFILAAIDPTVDPCEDFFQYACGKWLRDNPIGQGSRTGTFDTLADDVNSKIVSVLNGMVDNSTTTAKGKLKLAYDTCVNGIDPAQNPLIAFIKDQGGWPIVNPTWTVPADYSYEKFTATLDAKYGVPTLMSGAVEVDAKDINRNAIYLDQAQLLLQSIDYYTGKNPVLEKVRVAYVANIVSAAKWYLNYTGMPINEEVLKSDAQAILDFEIGLANIMTRDENRRNSSRLYNPIRYDQLKKDYPEINWDDYFCNFLPTSLHYQNTPKCVPRTPDSMLIVAEEEYIHKLISYLGKSDQRVVFNYQIWRLVYSLQLFFPPAQQAQLFELRVIHDKKATKKGDQGECADVLNNLLGFATGSLYVDNFFSEESRTETNTTINTILDSFTSLLADLKWLDAQSRENAMTKKKNVQVNPGYPDWIKDSSLLDAYHNDLVLKPTDTFFQMYNEMNLFQLTKSLLELPNKPDRATFITGPAVVNAFYDPTYNSITFPAGILNPPFFNVDFPKAINYGAIGVVIGHELTHAFDDQGVQYYYNGTLDTWMSEQSQAGFNQMATCVVDEYSQYCYSNADGMCVNGADTQGENIGDNGGVRESYLAYQKYLETHTEDKLPGLEQYSLEQIFFLSYGMVWCGAQSDAHLIRQLLIDPHSPGELRINATLKNFPPFAKAFQCQIGETPMAPNPSQKCDVWANSDANTTTFAFSFDDWDRPLTQYLLDPTSYIFNETKTTYESQLNEAFQDFRRWNPQIRVTGFSPNVTTGPSYDQQHSTKIHFMLNVTDADVPIPHYDAFLHIFQTAIKKYGWNDFTHSKPASEHVEAGKFLRSIVDLTVNPCEDFYQFACGGWIKNNPIPPGEQVYQVFSSLDDRTTTQLLEIFDKIDVSGQPEAVRKTKFAYDSCRNAAQQDISLSNQLVDLINSYGGWPMINPKWNPSEPATLAQKLGQLGKEQGIGPLMFTYADVDVKDVANHILYVDQPQLTLGLIDYYTVENNTAYQAMVEAYKSLIVKVTRVLANGTNPPVSEEQLKADAEGIFQLEKRLAQISVSNDLRRDQNDMYFPNTISDLNAKYPYFSWQQYFTALLDGVKTVDLNTRVIIASPYYFGNLTKVLADYTQSKTDPKWRDLVNYNMWRLVNQLLPFVDDESIRSQLHIVRHITDKKKKSLPLPKEECVDFLLNNLPWPTGRLYVDKFFPAEDRPVVKQTISDILNSFKGLLTQLDWMDDYSKTNAKNKSENVIINPAYPDFIKNNTELDRVHRNLTINPGEKFFTVWESITAWQTTEMYQKLNKHVDRTDFIMSPAVVNAWYQPQYNSITFPAAILQPPFFKNGFPWAVNYGGIGVVMGHELTHGFDDQGVTFDWDGSLNTWMDAQSLSGFTKMAKCVVDEYSGFCYPNINGQQQLCISGVNTQGENIADNGGIREAYNAYQKYIDTNGPENQIPGMEALTNEQIFFLSFASVWCGNFSDPALSKQLLTNPHSPGRDRVLGTVRNYEEFGKAFQCRQGVDKMFPDPQDKCDVWSKKSEPIYSANLTIEFYVVDYGKPWSEQLTDVNSKLYKSVVSQHIASVSTLLEGLANNKFTCDVSVTRLFKSDDGVVRFTTKIVEKSDSAANLLDTESVQKYIVAAGKKLQWIVEPISKGWTDAADFIKSAMDTTADPCKDFFQYSCGNWLESNQIPPGKARVEVFDSVQNLVIDTLTAALDSYDVSSPGIPESMKKLKFAYDHCVNSKQSQLDGNLPLLTLLQDRTGWGGWPIITPDWADWEANKTRYSPASFAGLLDSNQAVATLLTANVAVDWRNVTQHQLYVDQASLALGSPEYYLNQTHNATMEAFIQFFNHTALVLAKDGKITVDADKIASDARDIFHFEQSLAAITVSDEDRRNSTLMYNLMTVGDIKARWGSWFNWDSYFCHVLPNSYDFNPTKCISLHDSDEVVIVEPKYLDDLGKLISSTDKRIVANYLLGRLVYSLQEFLSDDIKAISRELRKIKDLDDTLPPAKSTCVGHLINYVGYAAGRLFIDKTFSDAARNEVQNTISNVIKSFEVTLKSLQWLDQTSKDNAYTKAEGVVINPAYPDWIVDNSQLDDYHKNLDLTDLNDYFDVYLKLQRWFGGVRFGRLSSPSDRKDFQGSPATVNAWYEPSYNSITFPAGILQPPFFRYDYPKAVNYGAIGAVIGHELTHGFDDEGVQYYWNGTLETWMTEGSQKGFADMAQCVVDEYSKFCFPSVGKCIDGETTQGENIGDNGGIREAFNAYRSLVASKGAELPLPGLEEFSGDQIFFLAFGNFWCGQETDAQLIRQLLIDPHSPPQYRVNGTLGNFPAFGKAFGCKPNVDPMYPPPDKRCNVWANPDSN